MDGTMFPIAYLPEEEESPSPEMKGEEVTMFPIMSLPEEVRGQIYNFLEQKEAMGLRLVCKQWQGEIHTFYNYHLQFDENNPHLQDILDRQRITDCTTGTFLLTPSDMTSIFKHANLIQSLTIREEASISPENLQALLTECAKSLKRLEIHLTKDLLRFEHPQDHFIFPNLRSLVVFVDVVHPYGNLERSPALQAHVDQEVLLINRLIRDSHKPKLTNLSIKLYLQNQLQVDWYSSAILSTVANHSKTLSRIDLDLQHADTPPYLIKGTFPSYQLEKEDRDRIRKADNLSCLNILIWGRSNNVLGSLGELSITQKLERLKIKVTQFEWAFLQEVCWNCFETLVSLNVTFIHSTSKTFDASCLKDCKKLKEVSFGRPWKKETDDSYRICNFHLLPESIDILKIEDICILTTELGEISSSGLKNLKYLQLLGCGVSPLYGVDGEVVQKLFLLPKLKNFEVNTRRYRDSDEQARSFEDFKISIEGDGDPQKTGICITSHYSHSDAGVVDLGLSSEWMMSQKKLETLRIKVEKFEWVFLQEVCWNCFETLVSINVSIGHSTTTSTTFDVSCLKNCKNLELLVLRYTMKMKDSYSICNLQLLPESIVNLSIWNISILTTELGEISSSGFRNLEQLRLMGCGHSALYGVDGDGEVFQKLFLLPKLRNIEVNIFNYPDYQEEANLAEFEDLKISVESDDSQETCIPITSDATYYAGANDLLGLSPEWKTTMSQKKLEKLKIHVEKLDSICLEKICWTSFGSLVSIEVTFEHSTIKTFDASCFKVCGNLKELILRRIPGEMGHCDNIICNFHLLPESIKTLKITSISILTTELEETCFRNLKHLELEKCGVYGLYGVGWKVFQKLFLLPKLCFIIVKDLNLSDSDEEADYISLRQSLRRTCWSWSDSTDYLYWVSAERSSPSCDSWRWWGSNR